jgi:hypothetical protein
MSLHTKLDTHQKALKAFLEEHAAMVEARLAAIEVRLPRSEVEEGDAEYWQTAFRHAEKDRDEFRNAFNQASIEASQLREENTILEKERDKFRIAYECIDASSKKLKDVCDRYREDFEASREEAGRLQQELETAKAATRYYGCYNLSGRRAPIRNVAELLTILGGESHVEKTLGIKGSTSQPWRAINLIPIDYKDVIEAALKERGYTADSLLFRRTREKR